PVRAQVIAAATPSRALIAVGETAPAARVAALQSAGAVVVPFPVREGRVAVDAVLAALFEREVCAVLVEGGGEVHASFLEAGVVDRVTLFVAPLLLGGRTAPAVVGGAGRDLKSAIRLGSMIARAVGDDLLIEADVLRDANGCPPDRRGGAVNLGRPLRFGGSLGGHLGLGHVDGTGAVEAVSRVESTARVRIALRDRGLAPLLVPQGSVAVDGVSLTVASLDDAAFEV